MPVPIVCLDAGVRQWMETFRACLSKPQYQHFVTVLLGLLLCHEAHTLTGLLRQVAGGPSLASVSRFLAHAPWCPADRAQTWLARFRGQMDPLVQAEQERQCQARPRRRGRPPEPVVTGYLIGDDSTMAKPKGKKMQGSGRHYSTTAGTHVRTCVGTPWSRGSTCCWAAAAPWRPNSTSSRRSARLRGCPSAVSWI